MFISTVIERNKLDPNIRSAASLSGFKKNLLKFIRPYFESILFAWPWCWNKYTFFFLYCPLFTNQRRTLLSTVNDIDSSLTNTNDSILTHILLFGQASLDISANILILNATRKYIISTNRFQENLFLVFCNFLLQFHLFNLFSYPYYVFFWDYTVTFIWF